MAAVERSVTRDQWLARVCPQATGPCVPASSDASFRRYFRIETPDDTLVLMDAPPGREDSRPFVDVAQRLLAAGVNVPRIIASDLEQGFLLLSDLGDRIYLGQLDDDNADSLYGDALDALARMQAHADSDGVPAYDAGLLHREMMLFPDWLLERHLGLDLDGVRDALAETFEHLAAAALDQPRVFVHRDYHSRNLMHTPANNPGILDFQDAVRGPVTYDLVSLLRDCYIAWPGERIDGWVAQYRWRAAEAGIEVSDADTFRRWFDLMGVQRHLKAAGIFARLYHRDGKPGYLPDVPRTWGYIREQLDRYTELRPLAEVADHLDIDRLIAS